MTDEKPTIARRTIGLVRFATSVLAVLSVEAVAQDSASVREEPSTSAPPTVPISNAVIGGGEMPGGDQYDAPSPIPPIKFALSPGNVDMRTGSYNYSVNDLHIGGEGDAGLSLTRRLASESLYPETNGLYQPFGQFFSHNWIIKLVETRIKVIGANYPNEYDFQVSVTYGGLGDSFRSTANLPRFVNRSHSSARLTFTGDPTGSVQYTYHSGDGTRIVFRQGRFDCESFDASRCLLASEIVRPDGTRYELRYKEPGTYAGSTVPLTSITSNRGLAILFETNESGLTSRACVLNLAVVAQPANGRCPAGVPTSAYVYDTPGQNGNRSLISATDASGAVSRFTLMSSPPRFALTQPGASTPFVTITYQPFGYDDVRRGGYRVLNQSFAGGAIYSYSWDRFGFAGEQTLFDTAGGSFTDATGQRAEVRYGAYQLANSLDATSDPTSYITPGPEIIRDQNGNTIRGEYCYAAPRDGFCNIVPLKRWIYPEGNQEVFTYDSYVNVKTMTKVARSGTALPSTVVTTTHDCAPADACDKLTALTDANGNRTDYTYDPVHGGVLTEIGPAVGGIRPQTRHEYVQRFAWLRSGAGYVRASSPIWLLSRSRSCRATAASGPDCVGGAADETVTTYEYGPDSGPNNLWLRGIAVSADVQTLRTCYGYDTQGRRISETRPNANLAVCP